MRFDNWHHNGICLKTKKKWKFSFYSILFSAAVCCYLRRRVHWHIRLFFLLSFLFFNKFICSQNSFCLMLLLSYICELFLLSLLFFWNSVIEHKLQALRRDVIAIELRINCSDRERVRDTHAHDNKTTKRQLSMKFLLFYILLVLSSFLQLNFFTYILQGIEFVHSRWYKM